jgi:Concanavalin A-like lectin/glucanases superfamily
MAVLSGRWTFDAPTIEASGTGRVSVDTAGSPVAAILEDGVDIVPMRRGECVRFDGTTRAVIPAAPHLTWSQTFSIAFYLNVTDEPTGHWRAIFYKPVAERDARGIGLWLYPDAMRLRAQLFTIKGPEFADSRTPLTPGRWTHVAVAVDPDEIYIFVDGEFDMGVPLEHPVVNTGGELVLGRDAGGGGFAGMLDDLRVYASTLTPAEVREISALGP